jgi:23S rRNA pseudouridine1911/1915/1917 synthase
VVLARTSKAAARLTEQFRSRDVSKSYWAIVVGHVEQAAGECVDWMAKDEARARMVIVRSGTPGAQEARLNYRRLQSLSRGNLLEVELLTGRKHQIRVQLAARGLPIVGDKKYGSHERFAAGIALHARRLAVQHPIRDEVLTFVAPLPRSWAAWGVDAGT